MDTSYIDSLVMTLLSAFICICLPRVLALIGSNISSSKLKGISLKASSASSQSIDYPKLTTVNN